MMFKRCLGLPLRAELESEESALRDLEKASGAVADKQQTLIRRIRAVKDEMFNLKEAGLQNTEMYREKTEELTGFRELKKEQELLSTGGSNLAGFMSGMSAVTGTLSAGAGAMGLLNIKNEDYARLQTRIQSLMAITIGLQQVQNTLHQTSAFRLHTVARAKQAWGAMIGFVNTKLNFRLGFQKHLWLPVQEEAYRVLFGTELFKDKDNDRPLSKFKRDILIELGVKIGI